MTTSLDFKREQRDVAIAMVGALVTTIVILGIVAIVSRTDAITPFDARLRSAIRIDVFVLAWLIAGIANVARLRFFSELDIAGGGAETGSANVRNASAILQNTFEQVGLAIGAHVIVAATFDHSTALIETLACLFAVGRLLFWAGYTRGARGRAFGFALTFYPSVIACLASAAAILFGWAV